MTSLIVNPISNSYRDNSEPQPFRQPKFKKGDHVHVIYSDGTHNAVTITRVNLPYNYINDYINDYNSESLEPYKIMYDYEYNFGTEDGSANEINLYLRECNDYRTSNGIIDDWIIESDDEDDLSLSNISTNCPCTINVSSLPIIKDDSECSICLKVRNGYFSKKKRVLSCGHSFHEGCIKEWFNNKNTCPFCRQRF